MNSVYILAFSFDFSWFLTIPGMLITGGVLLLIIALIIFIATSGSNRKKEKKEKEETKIETKIEEPVAMVSNGAEMVPAQEVQTPVSNVIEPVSPTPSVSTPPIVEPVVQDINVKPVVEPIPEPAPQPEPRVEPVVEAPVMNDITPSVVPPVNDTVVTPTVEPIVPKVEEVPTIAQEPVIPTVEEIKPQPSVSIYGGATPEVKEDVLKEEKPHQIYGGADPTDNTQTIPVLNHGYQYGEPVQKEAPVEYENKVEPPVVDTTPVFPQEEVTVPSTTPEEKANDVEVLDF